MIYCDICRRELTSKEIRMSTLQYDNKINSCFGCSLEASKRYIKRPEVEQSIKERKDGIKKWNSFDTPKTYSEH